MLTVSTQALVAYANADPTIVYTFGVVVDMGGHKIAAFLVTSSATSPTSYQLMIQTADAVGGPWAYEPLVEGIAGLGTARGFEIDLQDPDGTVLLGAIPITFERGARRFVRLALKRTGGAGTDRIAATVTLATE